MGAGVESLAGTRSWISRSRLELDEHANEAAADGAEEGPMEGIGDVAAAGAVGSPPCCCSCRCRRRCAAAPLPVLLPPPPPDPHVTSTTPSPVKLDRRSSSERKAARKSGEQATCAGQERGAVHTHVGSRVG